MLSASCEFLMKCTVANHKYYSTILTHSFVLPRPGCSGYPVPLNFSKYIVSESEPKPECPEHPRILNPVSERGLNWCGGINTWCTGW